MRKKIKAGIALLLGTVLTMTTCISQLPQMTLTACAAGNGKGIQAGAGPLGDNVNTANAPTVYFDSEPDAWKVIGYDGSGVAASSGTVTLLADDNIMQDTFNGSGSNNNYSNSKLYSNVNDIADRLTDGEKGAVSAKTLATGTYNSENTDCIAGDEVANALLWPLSTKEAGALNASLRTASLEWWLRSPGFDTDYAASVRSDGTVSNSGDKVYVADNGVRPAFSLNLSSIVLTSAATDVKMSGTAGAGALAEDVSSYSGSEWKLTLKDSSRSDFMAYRTDSGDVQAGSNITVKYENAKTGPDEFVSAIMLDAAGNVIRYGHIVDMNSKPASGTTKITVPADLDDGVYTIKVFSEKCNAYNMTDYASDLKAISITVGTPAEEPVFPESEEESSDYLDPLRKLLKEAKARGGEQTVTWNLGFDLPYDIMKTLEDNPELTLVFNYTYEGEDYNVTIPGEKAKAYIEIPWYGPVYLYNHYGVFKSKTSAGVTLSGDHTYKVVRGDTLGRIARRLNTTVKDLVKLNGIQNPDFIREGQILKY